MNEMEIRSESHVFPSIMVPMKAQANISFWRKPSPIEIVPIGFLALEVFLGLFFNLAAAWIYFAQSGSLKNAGNKFTVSLIVDDLILSGIATPLVLILQLIQPTASPLLLNLLCLCTRSALLFSAISSASGNTLLALDRVDITLRPSRRFFRKRRPVRAVAFVWLLSTLGLIFPLFSTWASHSFQEMRQYNQTVILKKQTWVRLGTGVASADHTPLDNIDFDTYCMTTCYSDYCQLNEMEITVRQSFQMGIFAMAAVIIFVSYFQILKSIQQRNVRHAKKSVHPDNVSFSSAKKTQRSLQRIFCCSESHERDVLLAMNAQAHQNSRDDVGNISKTRQPRISVSSMKSPKNSRLNEKMDENTFSKQHENGAEGEEESHCIKQNENSGAGMLIVAHNHENKGSSARTDFVSVALSVKAIMTMKKMVREKKKRKAKKIRHLKLMTVLITLTFVICWTPFNVFPLLKLLTNQAAEASSICEVQFCFDKNNSTIFEVGRKLTTEKKRDPVWNALFLWTLVLASASSVANPFLYSFSREKIRQNFRKMFCSGRQTRDKIISDLKKKDLQNVKPKHKKRTSVWTFDREKNKGKNLENVDIVKPLVDAKKSNKHTLAAEPDQIGATSASTTDVRNRLLPDTASQNTTRANDESTVETSCTSAVTNRGSYVE